MAFGKLDTRAGRLVRTLAVCCLLIATPLTAVAQSNLPPEATAGTPALEHGLHLFYSGRYEPSAEVALSVRTADPENLATYDLRTSALHFQLRRAMGDGEDRERLYKQCSSCAAIVANFMEDFAAGRAAARAQVAADPADQDALYYLGKLDLNYVWMRLGTLGQRTGWNEYWEARRSLDAVLKANPRHPRARIARAWIDYIVDTKMTRGFRWILGGGNRKRALATVREVAASDVSRFDRAEAGFALWDMEQRERNLPAAVMAAQQLAREFPENQELVRFLEKNGM
ncbi:MAG: hypothetical protein IT184_07005 [Acidobacteria bacterium]|nr:hypothetical protein [Acidobacteriota bacterium]